MARNKMGGLLALAALGGVAWWLMQKKAPAAVAGHAWPVVESTSLNIDEMTSAGPELMMELVGSGQIPPDAANVMIIPMSDAPATAVIDMPGTYVIGDSRLPGAGGVGIPGAVTLDGFGRSPVSSFARTVASQQRSPGVFQGYGDSFMNTIMSQQQGLNGLGDIPPYYERDSIPYSGMGDYVQLPYNNGQWAH